MNATRHLLSLCAATGLALVLTACGPSTPQEKVVASFEDAIERVEKAKTQKALNGTSQILIGDINKSLKGLSPVEQNKVMTSKEVTTIERVYNKKLTEKRKSLR
ncbi:MAG: hypothetical protein IJT28_04805 [Bacteroidaceae bacterium]|nr:hypothetical protein [Bacteroidaceae bacterium]